MAIKDTKQANWECRCQKLKMAVYKDGELVKDDKGNPVLEEVDQWPTMPWCITSCSHCRKERPRPDKTAQIKAIRTALKTITSDPYITEQEEEVVWNLHQILTKLEDHYETGLNIIYG